TGTPPLPHNQRAGGVVRLGARPSEVAVAVPPEDDIRRQLGRIGGHGRTPRSQTNRLQQRCSVRADASESAGLKEGRWSCPTESSGRLSTEWSWARCSSSPSRVVSPG